MQMHTARKHKHETARRNRISTTSIGTLGMEGTAYLEPRQQGRRCGWRPIAQSQPARAARSASPRAQRRACFMRGHVRTCTAKSTAAIRTIEAVGRSGNSGIWEQTWPGSFFCCHFFFNRRRMGKEQGAKSGSKMASAAAACSPQMAV